MPQDLTHLTSVSNKANNRHSQAQPLDKLCKKLMERLIFHIKDIIIKLIAHGNKQLYNLWHTFLHQDLDEHLLIFILLPYADFFEMEINHDLSPFAITPFHTLAHPLIIKHAYLCVLKELKTLRRHRFFANSPYANYSLIDISNNLANNKERIFYGIPNNLCQKLILGLRETQKAKIIIKQNLARRYADREGMPSTMPYSSLHFLHPRFADIEIKKDTRKAYGYSDINPLPFSQRRDIQGRLGWKYNNPQNDVPHIKDLAIQAHPLSQLIAEGCLTEPKGSLPLPSIEC